MGFCFIGLKPFRIHPFTSSYSTTPLAYLTILFFDERFNLLPLYSQTIRVTNQNDPNAYLLLTNLKAPKNGFAYIYISNASPSPVYFDNLQITQFHSPIIEESHYYAFGLKIAGISSHTIADPNEGHVKNKNLYNDKELDTEADLNWYDYGFRNYDPQIGRFVQQDPLSSETPDFSPYHIALNDPINYIDEDGLDAIGFFFQAGGCFGNVGSFSFSVASSTTSVLTSAAISATSIGVHLATASLQIANGFGGPETPKSNPNPVDNAYKQHPQQTMFASVKEPKTKTMKEVYGKWLFEMSDDEINYLKGEGGFDKDINLTIFERTYILSQQVRLFCLPVSLKYVSSIKETNAAKTGGNLVYHSVEAGVTQYVGITNNLARRAAQHLGTKGIKIEPLMQGLTRSDARAVEQALIEIHGLGKNGGTLLNKINSISPTNPAYGSQLQRGYELLKSIGYH